MWDLRVHIIFSTLKGTNFGRSYDLIHPSIILSNLSNLNMTKKARQSIPSITGHVGVTIAYSKYIS